MSRNSIKTFESTAFLGVGRCLGKQTLFLFQPNLSLITTIIPPTPHDIMKKNHFKSNYVRIMYFIQMYFILISC